ncbi:protease [Arthrobacter cheniae]|uniref:Protease n=1 Tax=Arthrobacter cheniae TaxID=1258888 RepID=A0A3A5MBZ1_9MICC|nr:S8 family peptidase [Arthrobacter cheniae]RJT80232.1 protease [Arthrobacter cheniae]
MTQRRKAGRERSTLRAATAIVLGLPLLLTSTAVAPAVFAAPAPVTAVTPQKAPVKALDPAQYPDGKYIVVLADKPLATYEGGVEGIAPTKPEKGAKLDADAENVKQYSAFLETKQQDIAAEGNVEIKRTYTAALNGFSADLSTDQAVELAKSDEVLLVAPDVENAPDYSSIDFLGLSGNKGTWKSQFGGEKNAGAGTVVGVIDTGYAPDNPFLSGSPVKPLPGNAPAKVGEPYLDAKGNIAMLKTDGTTFVGECQVGEGFDGSLCNSKVLSARYFADAFIETVPEGDQAPQEVISPVDIDNHGTHTASTAAGNAGVTQTVDGRNFGVSSGVAPAAKVSVYKICWEDKDPATGGCYSSAAVDAINQAVLDGVDVLNYSISGSTTTTTDPVSLAFLSAASAGVFVAVSAGNSGPTASTVNHGAPWLSTVAASTFSYELQGTAEFSDGTKYRGASIMRTGVPASPVVLAVGAAAAAAPTAPALCGPNTLDPAKVAGKIVVCDRGVVDRVAKSTEVKRAGGVGMILVNLVDSSTDTDQHAVPTVHVNAPEGPELKTKVAANPALTVALLPTDTTGKPLPPTPQVAGFSSRGPLLATDSDLLKPDITAPGVAVLAGVSTVGSAGEQFGFLSGTSMASPHVAGLGALVLGKNPTWSPAAVKSAMMTTAYPLKKADGSVETDVLAVGAGHINPASVLSPGLVYDQSPDDYLRFIAGTGVDLGIDGITPVAAKDTNVPSFALGNLIGRTEVTRTVTATTPGLYRATANVPGVKVTITPSILNFSAAGETRTFKVSFENQSAAAGQFAAGSLTWSGQGKKVTSPVAVRPQTLKAPAEVNLAGGANGSGSFNVTSGTSTPIQMTLDGLARAATTAVELVPGDVVNGNDASNAVQDVTVPAGTKTARFSILADDPTSDFDMFVIPPSGPAVTVATADASETLILENPAPGTYRIVANLFSSTDNAPTSGTIEAVLLNGAAGNATLTPNPFALANGSTGAVTLNWTGLTAGTYVGRVTYAGSPTITYVRVVVDGAGVATVEPSADPAAITPADKLVTGPREAITPTGNK